MSAGGTEAFPDLGKHCQHSDCHQLDFLPFKCEGCLKVFCLEHRSYKSHECPKSDHKSRKVIVCEICSTSIEITGKEEEEEKIILEKHEKSGNCDPRKKKKPTCPVRRCKESLTFSNRTVCKTCQLEVCLKHRFPTDHACKQAATTPPTLAAKGGRNEKFLAAFASRNGKDCAKSGRRLSPTTPSVKAY
ncbi:hypothetical protein REPUB_Repub10bG0035300 [Reevesia pubescens]